MHETKRAIALMLTCALPACDHDADPHPLDAGQDRMHADEPRHAQAGTCAGEATGCPPPDVETVVLPDAITCSLEPTAPASIVWRVPLGDMDCAVGRCRLLEPALEVAEDGSFWVVGILYPAAPEPLAAVIGVGLKHFDSNGNEIGATTLAVKRRFWSHRRSVVRGGSSRCRRQPASRRAERRRCCGRARATRHGRSCHADDSAR